MRLKINLTVKEQADVLDETRSSDKQVVIPSYRSQYTSKWKPLTIIRRTQPIIKYDVN